MKDFKKLKGWNHEAGFATFSLHERGFAQIIILLILIAGLFAAVYLVRQTQIFKPKASFTTTAEFIDSSGNPIMQTTDRNVRLRIVRSSVSSAPSSIPVASTAQDQATPTQAQPTATNIPLPTSTPVPTPIPPVDSDGDGDPDSSDCGLNNPSAKVGQTQYFSTPYTDSSGRSSFDYNCSGGVEDERSNIGVSSLPEINCYNIKPPGEQGWASSSPACGTSGRLKTCYANVLPNCGNGIVPDTGGGSTGCASTAYDSRDNQTKTAVSWKVREDTTSVLRCH